MIEDLMMESETGETEGEFAEVDEGYDEAEEDLGEAWRRGRRRGSRPYYGRSRPNYGRRRVNGVSGLKVPGRNGEMTSVPFPAKVATAAETNRALATHEVARHELEERLERLESRARTQPKRDAATSGLVTLALGGGLATWGVVEASNSGGLSLGNWAKQTQADAAVVVSLAQLATSGAKVATNHRYIRSGFGIAGDVFAAGFVLLYSFGKLHQPATLTVVNRLEGLDDAVKKGHVGDHYLVLENHSEYVAIRASDGELVPKQLT